jgi:hypothetical protein
MMALPSVAQNELSSQGILAIAKMAGACGILDSMIQMQKTTKMPGGDEFVTRFWSVEAARLGMTVEQLSQRCNESIGAYNKLWNAVEE